MPGANNSKDAAWRYAVAVLSVGAGLLLRLVLAGVLGTTSPYVTFFAAVMFAAWFGGFGPGLAATFLSVIMALYFVVPPVFQLRPATREDAVGAILFVGVSILVSLLNETLRRSRARLAELARQAERDRDLFQTTLASIGDAVIATDADGRVTFLNTVAEALTGWSRTDALGRSIKEIVVIQNGKTRLPVENPVERAIREGVIVGLANHTILVSRDGREIPIENSAAPIRAEGRQALGAVLAFRDVTARGKSQDALARSEQRLKLVLDAGQIGVWDWDVIENRIEWSDLVYDLHGMERGTFQGGVEEFAKLIHPEDRGRVQQAIEAALHQGAPYELEFRSIHSSGKLNWLTTQALVLRNEKGEPIRMLGGVADVTARKQAQTSLKQQWSTFDTALSNTPDFTYIFDLDGRFSYINRALLSLLQISLEAGIGKNFFDLGYPYELAERLQRQIQEVIQTKGTLRDHTPFTGPTGETRYYEYIFVPVLGANGDVEAVAGSTRDITERRASEEALRISEARVTLALEAGGGIGTWDWDLRTNLVYCNAQFARLFSVDPEIAAVGAPVAEFFVPMHADDRARVERNIQQAIAKGGDFAEEYRLILPDGSERWVYARGRCQLDSAGKPTRLPGVVFDITEQKRAQESLRESQERLRAIYDGTYEYIGLLAPDGTLLEANRALLEFAQNTRVDVMGQKFWDTPWFTGTPGAAEIVRESIARAALGEFIRFEATLRRPSGESQTFDISFYPIRNEAGEVVLIVPEGRNIDDRKRAEEEVKRSNEQLTRVNRELEEFAYVASHDLQEPLRIVNIYTQLILKDLNADKDKLAQFASFVQQGVRRMDALIHDLLTFSRAVHADELPVGTADLGASLAEALSVLKNRIEESGAAIQAGSLPTVRGDASQLAHVFQNLLSNSLKYGKKGIPSDIRISAERAGDHWTVAIRDNGIGFEPQYADRIFGLFKRLHKDEYPGTGLGLAICKRVVERYGGRIWADGRLGEGATFYFTLPAADV